MLSAEAYTAQYWPTVIHLLLADTMLLLLADRYTCAISQHDALTMGRQVACCCTLLLAEAYVACHWPIAMKLSLADVVRSLWADEFPAVTLHAIGQSSHSVALADGYAVTIGRHGAFGVGRLAPCCSNLFYWPRLT